LVKLLQQRLHFLVVLLSHLQSIYLVVSLSIQLWCHVRRFINSFSVKQEISRPHFEIWEVVTNSWSSSQKQHRTSFLSTIHHDYRQ
jgi:hypothetical protein